MISRFVTAFKSIRAKGKRKIEATHDETETVPIEEDKG